MTLRIKDLVRRIGLPELREYLGDEVLKLVAIFDNRLIESNAVRELVLGVDGGRTFITSSAGWKMVVGILPQAVADDLCNLLKLKTIDAYGALESFNISNASSEQCNQISNFLEIPPEPNFREYEKVWTLPVTPLYELFDHQRKPALNVMKVFRSGASSCVLHLPTGGGKTRTSMVFICRWLIENPGTCVVWLAASEELLDQASTEFERAWSNLGDRTIRVERVWGSARLPNRDLADTFLVGGLKKLVSILDGNPEKLIPLSQKVSLIVFDEAHQAIAPTYKDLVGFLRSRNGAVPLLGLTATPGRTVKNEEEDEKLAEFFSYRKVEIDAPGFKSPVDFLVAEGYLAKANFIDVKFESKSYDKNSCDPGEDFSKSTLDIIGDDNKRNVELIKAAIALSSRHKRVLLFAPSVKSACHISMVLSAAGIDSYSLDGSTDELSRRMMIDKFRGNLPDPQVLCNFGVLTTGFDAPRTSCVIIGRPTNSVVLYSQMVGRALRGSKVGGNPEADVVTVVDTALKGFGNVADGFNFWDKKWW